MEEWGRKAAIAALKVKHSCRYGRPKLRIEQALGLGLLYANSGILTYLTLFGDGSGSVSIAWQRNSRSVPKLCCAWLTGC